MGTVSTDPAPEQTRACLRSAYEYLWSCSAKVCSERREPLQIQLYYVPHKGEARDKSHQFSHPLRALQADHEFMVLAGDRERLPWAMSAFALVSS